MIEIEILKNQHSDLLDLAREVSVHLSEKRLSRNSAKILKLLTMLHDKMRIHLTIEDESLYPSLLDSPDSQVKELALKYTDDANRLLELYSHYLDAWGDEEIIKKKRDEFIQKTEQIIGLLLDRIYIEDNILFPRINDHP